MALHVIKGFCDHVALKGNQARLMGGKALSGSLFFSGKGRKSKAREGGSDKVLFTLFSLPVLVFLV